MQKLFKISPRSGIGRHKRLKILLKSAHNYIEAMHVLLLMSITDHIIGKSVYTVWVGY